MAVHTNSTESEAFERQLWDILDERISKLAPAYQPLLNGTLTAPALKAWAGQVYVENKPFVRVLGGILAGCDDPLAQEYLADDLYEETGRGDPSRNHVAIIGRFATACGHRPEELDSVKPTKATEKLVDYYLSLRDLPWVHALAAVGIGLEGSFLARPDRELPATMASTAADILQSVYGFADDDVEFFRLHDLTDVEHTRRALELVTGNVRDEQDRRQVVVAVREMVDHVAEWAEATINEAVA